jgi:hypothetical protein
LIIAGISLLLTDLEHLGATGGTGALGSGAEILHGDGFGILHFPLGAAFDTVSLNGHIHLLI